MLKFGVQCRKRSQKAIEKFRNTGSGGSINNLAPTTTFKWLHAGPGELRSDNVFVRGSTTLPNRRLRSNENKSCMRVDES